MRHQNRVKKLGRTSAHRKQLLRNLTSSLFYHYNIVTSLPKAKATRSFAERLISFGKKNTLAARREALKKLPDRKIIKKLFDEIAPAYANVNGGYTRIMKLGLRKGDGAEKALLELIGFEDKIKEHVDRREQKREERKKKGEEAM